ncbi:MAG: hypothetical protein LBC77_04560 [Spirochaetaceae bacterium]|jgi:hypothetical protein|nr:hypothetical protein [Spirochaetaceae bacterium]
MAVSRDFVPARDADFDGWISNLTVYVDGKTSGGAWTHIPAAKVTELKQQNGLWHTAYEKVLSPHTSVDTSAKNDARKAVTTLVRHFIAQYLKFEPVTNEDRTAMRLRNSDTIHTTIRKPASRAIIGGLKSLGGFRTEIRFHDEETPGKRAIPYGMNGCLLNYSAGDERTEDYEFLKDTVLMTRSPFILTLPPEAEGKFLSCSVRWQSERGELGPWGEIQHIVVG